MNFASQQFAIFFLAVFALYYALPRRFQSKLLLCANLFFYWCSGPVNLLYIGATALSTYWAGRRMGAIYEAGEAELKARKDELSKEEKKALKASVKAHAKRVLLFCLVFNLGILGVCKYIGMFTGRRPGWIVVPLAISFYTFMAVSYAVDVYWKKIWPEKNLFSFALFITYFPQLVQGPISRFSDLGAQLTEAHDWDGRRISAGFLRVLWGLCKKLIVADRIAIPLRAITGDPSSYSGPFAAFAVLFYAVQLYADFTGGIDITLGISRMLGIELAENFNRPYFSKNIAEYWRRWHITMGSWFRDYVFYPLYTSKLVNGWMRKIRSKGHPQAAQRVGMYFSTLCLWALTGLWHGASTNFVIWGLLNGIVILASRECEGLYKRFHEKFPGASKSGFYRGFQCIRTFLLMALINVLDIYPSAGAAARQLGSILRPADWAGAVDKALSGLGIGPWDWLCILLGILAMFAFSMRERKGNVFEAICEKKHLGFALGLAAIAAVLVFGIYGIGYDASAFIYNQF